jgi:carbohydrate diacid regulator
MQGVVGKTVGIIDRSCVVVACGEFKRIGQKIGDLPGELFTEMSSFVVNGCTYMSFGGGGIAPYAVFVDGENEDSKRCVDLLIVALNNIEKYQGRGYDCEAFIKNLLLGNILSSEVDAGALTLGFKSTALRVCILIRLGEKSSYEVYDFLRGLFPDKTKDFVVTFNRSDIVLVKEIVDEAGSCNLENLAKSTMDALANEFCTDCSMGIGSSVRGSLNGLVKSFKEAKISLEIGKIFYTKKKVMSHDRLGVARLIYNLPSTLCEVFLREIFKFGREDSLDDETLFTVQRFFESNLNISETSRKLFLHRNTLVYRLEKIKKVTGLDVRDFEDAAVLKVALMVKKYLSHSPVRY